ncbi:hypothetical protein BDA99DRAFT_608518 [Phascolomyces articulosus]|uniref:Actin-like ATPase domain-containing protein n=1 Tax=Phascolomyces articulosus TaxID=60185 RepID=A0AAD5P9J1_9FUNG|nr:hypothetical protein BDA99DRAFT_608518 [Phascolomyces articulosus]
MTYQLTKAVDYAVVIAYDFGTTYSGAAYAFTHTTPAEIFDIQNWPHKGGNFYPKVPTVSVYPRNNQQDIKTTRRPTLSEWGHSAKKAMIKPGAARQNILLSQFKLHLDESLKRTPLENGITPVQAVADYLGVLHKHTLEELKRGFAKNYDTETFRYCLTVPAVWSDKAKQLMRQAAIQAGLISASDPSDRLILISEPEAAALYCEETMSGQVQLQDKDRIMICDAGGGTVDLIVFQVTFLDNDGAEKGNSGRRKRQLKEVTKGIGESCGSVFLDDQFRELLKAKLGKNVMSRVSPRDMYTMMEYFIDTIKPQFTGADDFYLELPRSVKLEDLPASVRDNDRDGYLNDGILHLTSQELEKQVFGPVVKKVISLIERQYKQIPDGRLEFLFLVGGFGSSKYLYQRVHEAFQHTKVNQIVCPLERAALAVVRGAAYYGIHPEVVVSRISRRTYGIDVQVLFDDKIDIPSKRVVLPDGVIKCKDRFSAFVKKNSEMSVNHCVQDKYYVYYGQFSFVGISLYATENDAIPRYCDEPGVYRVANISVPIPIMPRMEMNGRLYYTVSMYFGKTEIRMEADFGTGQKYDVRCDFDVAFKYGS